MVYRPIFWVEIKTICSKGKKAELVAKVQENVFCISMRIFFLKLKTFNYREAAPNRKQISYWTT